MKYLLRTKVVLAISVGWVVVSVGLSAWRRDWSWFARSGAILTLGGAILTVRPLLRLGPDGFYRDQHTIDGGHAVPTAEEKAEGRDDVGASYIGFFCAVIGTII